ncbi:MAG: isocitrate lyase/phosphoenolpyruvate mutase family protein [Rhodobacteraceae bacterium]|nr:isocitrate lyase/phosphoenolpyruvate mutase family protein [Paracoccaceae bacterium]
MTSLIQKHQIFRDLHSRPGAFVMPNPWSAGSAMILGSLGFEALATTSAGLAFSIGKTDSEGAISRDEILANARDIVAACDLPVSADLENGFGAAPKACEITILQAMEIGLVGGSIEDTTGYPDSPIYEFDLAVERIQAAAETCADKPFLLTARAENFVCGRPDLADTIARLQAFSEAGAEVLYAPGLPDLALIATLCRNLDKPVNVVMGLSGPNWSVTDLADAGVKRISVGGSFARAALGALVRAANEILEQGTFGYAEQALSHAEASRFMTQRTAGNS